ncbi:MAG: hypothetical protein GY795_47240 [Desulfobacterales bacterium]|nr:hypothetical protein [Desulfobacterales bacterium]
MDIGTVLTSGVVAALISGIIAIRNSERNFEIENITKERTKWREKIREKNVQIQEAHQNKESGKIEAVGAELRLLLNPMDALDRDILSEINWLKNSESTPDDMERFSIKLSLLLKHDWERAKQETKNAFHKKVVPVKRITYEDYQKELI